MARLLPLRDRHRARVQHDLLPSISPTAGTLAAFATYAAGFGARPIGAIVAGHLGDRVGRKAILVAALILMGSATTLIGVLPGYASIGALAPTLLVVLRLLQGFAVGGEWGGSAVLAAEHAPPGRRGWFGSFTQIGAVKVHLDRVATDAATALFDVGGASASGRARNLDRHWRNIRTITLHNPASYKAAALGRLAISDEPLPVNGYF